MRFKLYDKIKLYQHHNADALCCQGGPYEQEGIDFVWQSPKGGNSDILCDEFLRGAQDAGHKAEKIRVAEKKVAPCSGCYYCSTHGGACVHKDDMADILQKMIDADVIVLASPVYFYSISAQLKAVIDRTVARWLEVKDKEFYYITTMADEEKSSADTTLACFRGYADCVEGAVEKGVLVAGGVYEPGVVQNTSAMAQAYEMGRNVSWQ